MSVDPSKLLRAAAALAAPQALESLVDQIVQIGVSVSEDGRAWLFLDEFGSLAPARGAPDWVGEVPLTLAPVEGVSWSRGWELTALTSDTGRTGLLAVGRPLATEVSGVGDLALHMGHALAAASNYAMLEQLVEQEMATAVAREEAIQLLLDNMAEGLLVVDLDGVATSVRSAAVTGWLGDIPEDGPVWSWLAGEDAALAVSFDMNFQQLSWQLLPFEVCADQMPTRIRRGERTFSLRYAEVFENGELARVMIGVSDITDALQAQADAEARQEMEAVVGALLANSRSFRSGLEELDRLVADVLEARTDDTRERLLHTVKGNGALLGFQRLAREVHRIEDALEKGTAWSDGLAARLEAAWSRARGSVQALVSADQPGVALTVEEHARFRASLVQAGVSMALVAEVDAWTAPTIGATFSRYEREVARLAEGSGRRVTVVTEGGDVRVTGAGQQAAISAMVHVIRNCMEHGFESSEDRRAAGKMAEGTLTLVAERLEDALKVTISDDGRGVDRQAVRRNADRLGLPASASLFDCLCAGSTRTEVSELSGRGVGVAALADALADIGGTAEVWTAAGQGTTFTFLLPTLQLDAEVRAAG